MMKSQTSLEIKALHLRERKDGLTLAKEIGFIPVSVSLTYSE